MTRRLGGLRRVLVAAFDGFQALDVTGPFDVFALAAAAAGGAPPYEVELAAVVPGSLRSSSGLLATATKRLGAGGSKIDTLLVAGGRGAWSASDDTAFLHAIARVAPHVRRVGSVCTGAFVLAAAGLLDGRRATTHWQFAAELAARYPRVRVDADAIFVRDGNVYTSAGVTAGIDLALAMVEEDLGRDVALAVARDLVVFARRPGGQTQFSAQLAAQFAEDSPLRSVQRWMLDHPDEDLSVERCAARAGMSPRNFARVFRRELRMTPAAWVESMRVERAQSLLVDSDRGVEDIATRCGFGSAETMRRAFVRRVQMGRRSTLNGSSSTKAANRRSAASPRLRLARAIPLPRPTRACHRTAGTPGLASERCTPVSGPTLGSRMRRMSSAVMTPPSDMSTSTPSLSGTFLTRTGSSSCTLRRQT